MKTVFNSLARCCLTDGCNAEPTAPPTTEPPTTTESPTTTETPTTIHATQIIPLSGSSGGFTSPGFPGNYPPNVNITWIKTGVQRGRALVLDFFTINTEAGRDIITVSRGNSLLRRISGILPRPGKRSLSLPLFPEDGPCEFDDDGVDDDGDDSSYGTAYDSLSATYYFIYRRQSRRPVLRLCVPGNGQQISINFSSDGNDTGQQGFEAMFRVRRGDDRK